MNAWVCENLQKYPRNNTTTTLSFSLSFFVANKSLFLFQQKIYNNRIGERKKGECESERWMV